MATSPAEVPIEQQALATHYVSTYCMHGKHGDCRLTCMHCDGPCRCSCHQPAQP